jgi:hypothetical protein
MIKEALMYLFKWKKILRLKEMQAVTTKNRKKKATHDLNWEKHLEDNCKNSSRMLGTQEFTFQSNQVTKVAESSLNNEAKFTIGLEKVKDDLE